METSTDISELIGALVKAQATFTPATKSKTNPHLKNKYATLDDVIAAVRGPLSENGLAIVQPVSSADGVYSLETRILHTSGQWMSEKAQIPEMSENRAVSAAQSLGAAITYTRRYMLSSMLNISTEEDVDGNGTTTRKAAKKPPPKKPLDPTPPDFSKWDDKQWGQLKALAVKQLGYDDPAHVKNTLAKIFDNPATTTYAGAWSELVKHQQAKEAADA